MVDAAHVLRVSLTGCGRSGPRSQEPGTAIGNGYSQPEHGLWPNLQEV